MTSAFRSKSAALLALTVGLLAGTSMAQPPWGGPPSGAPYAGPPQTPPPQSSPSESTESLGRAEYHLKEAMKALGEAGSSAYAEHAPALKEKALEAVGDAKRLFNELEQKLNESKGQEAGKSGQGAPAPQQNMSPPPGWQGQGGPSTPPPQGWGQGQPSAPPPWGAPPGSGWGPTNPQTPGATPPRRDPRFI